MALRQSWRTLPGVSAPSSVVRSILGSASLSAVTLGSFLMLRVASRATRASTPTWSTTGTRSRSGAPKEADLTTFMGAPAGGTGSGGEQDRVERELDHLVEGGLAFLRREVLAGA